LVNNRRWPQKRWPKLSSPWQGPFKIVKFKFNSLEVMASPSLGGVSDAALHICKACNVYFHDERFEDVDVDEEPQDAISSSQPMQEDQEIFTPEEQAQMGFYNVHKITKHKFQQGWKFLVWLENFPISASTWEPVSAFVLPNGSVNSVFKEYCIVHALTNVLQRALSGT